MALGTAITNLQTILTTDVGSGPPTSEIDQTNAFPFAVVSPPDGTVTVDFNRQKRGLHTLHAEIHVARNDVPKNVAQLVADHATAVSLIETVTDSLLSPTNITLTGAVDTINQIRYTFVSPFGFRGIDTLGYLLEVDVKIMSDTGA